MQIYNKIIICEVQT